MSIKIAATKQKIVEMLIEMPIILCGRRSHENDITPRANEKNREKDIVPIIGLEVVLGKVP